jgi:hypothetical protein
MHLPPLRLHPACVLGAGPGTTMHLEGRHDTPPLNPCSLYPGSHSYHTTTF